MYLDYPPPPLKIYKVTPNFCVNYPPMSYKNNADKPLNLHIKYPTVSFLRVKVTPKSESKLYNYNKVLKCTNINF